MHSGKSRREVAATADVLTPNVADWLSAGSSSSAAAIPPKFEWRNTNDICPPGMPKRLLTKQGPEALICPEADSIPRARRNEPDASPEWQGFSRSSGVFFNDGQRKGQARACMR